MPNKNSKIPQSLIHLQQTVKARTFLGDEFEVLPTDFIGKSILKHGWFDKNELDMITSVLTAIKPRTSLDIGSNIGIHASVISRLSNETHSFEPNPVIYNILGSNIDKNGLNIKSHNVGLSCENASMRLYVNIEGNTGKTTFVPSEYSSGYVAIDSSVVHGDDFIRENAINDIDFIKIDTEGYEGNVVNGLSNTIRHHQPVLTMEWNNDLTRKAFIDDGIFSRILQGYHIASVKNRLTKHMYRGPFRNIIWNFKKILYDKNQDWCLTPFEYQRGYNSIIIIPDRYMPILNDLPWFSNKQHFYNIR